MPTSPRRTVSTKRRAAEPTGFSRPSWLWRWHHLIAGFVLFFGVGMMLGAFQYSTVKFPAVASASENLTGWIWADPAGWISVNSDNPCTGSCGSYGVNMTSPARTITGFAWSDVSGWICFGASCSAVPACSGTPPAGALTAYADTGAGTAQLHGWAKICNQGNDGWISLNCTDVAGACVAATPYYRVVFNPSSGYFSDAGVSGTSFAWNGTSIGTGFGYMDFQGVRIRGEGPPQCNDGLDNDANGLRDCQESSCSAESNCTENLVNGNCADGIDNNLNGPRDCQEVACQSAPSCNESAGNGTTCDNGFDDNGNGQIDCLEGACAGYPTCSLAGEAACGTGLDACCSNGTDDDSNGPVDCADTSCLPAPVCTPAWLAAKFGNVYAQQGITGQEPVGEGQAGSSATYCLSSQGAITGFESAAGCTESGSQTLVLPKEETGYQGTLGSLDIPGIMNGRYGQVVTFTGVIPDVLDGKVYKATGNIALGARQFRNGTGATQRGNGLLIVEGDLTITGNLSYQSNTLSQYLRNLASFGVIVKKRSDGTGGNIYIQPGVTDLVGAYFAEDTIYTGTVAVGTDQPLRVLGLMAAYRMNLQRNYRDPVRAAEEIVFDGRAVANPPPGMQEVSQSLPTSRDAF